MEIKEHLAELAEIMQSGCGPAVGYEEVQHWPKGRLEELIEMGVLAKAMYAKRITCMECAQGECSGIEPTIETIQETGETAGFFLCPQWGGLKKVSEEELQQWVIVVEKLEELGCLADQGKRESGIEVQTDKLDFQFTNGQIFYKNTELPLPTGRPQQMFQQLVNSFPRVVKYHILEDSQNEVYSAGDQLRKDISIIKKALRKNRIAYTIKAKRNIGYHLTISK